MPIALVINLDFTLTIARVSRLLEDHSTSLRRNDEWDRKQANLPSTTPSQNSVGKALSEAQDTKKHAPPGWSGKCKLVKQNIL